MSIPPHRAGTPATTVRRGFLWITGDPVARAAGTAQRGQMFVEWIAPETVTRAHPVVLVHGGGGQGTDWLGTPDGRPGWAQRFVEAGYAVYVVDRPGFGRSPYDPDILGGHLGQTSSEVAAMIFASPDAESTQTRWPWGRTPASPELEQLVASSSFLLADAALSQDLDGRRLVDLLDLIGPAIVITHSAGAPAGWLALNRRPAAVAALIALEPMGPPHLAGPGLPTLAWGLTAAPVVTEPETRSAAEVAVGWNGRRIVGFDRAPILLVCGEASVHGRTSTPAVRDFLEDAGAQVELVDLGDCGITGNGHAFMLESNSDETIAPVLDWLEGVFG